MKNNFPTEISCAYAFGYSYSTGVSGFDYIEALANNNKMPPSVRLQLILDQCKARKEVLRELADAMASQGTATSVTA